MAIYKCYIDKEGSTYFNTKIKDKTTGKRIVLKDTNIGSKLNFKAFLLWHSENKQLLDKKSNTYIEISGTQVGENKSTIFLTTKKTGQYWKIIKGDKNK